jgi:hypothetical protein
MWYLGPFAKLECQQMLHPNQIGAGEKASHKRRVIAEVL